MVGFGLGWLKRRNNTREKANRASPTPVAAVERTKSENSESSPTSARSVAALGTDKEKVEGTIGEPLERVKTSSDKSEQNVESNPPTVATATTPPATGYETPRLTRRSSIASVAHSLRSLARRASSSQAAMSTSTPTSTKQRPVLSIKTHSTGGSVSSSGIRSGSDSTVSRSGSGSSGGHESSSTSISTAHTSPDSSCLTLPPPASPFKARPPPTFSPIHGPCPDVYILPPTLSPRARRRSTRSQPSSPKRVSTADLVFGPQAFEHAHQSQSSRSHNRARSLDGHSLSSSAAGTTAAWRVSLPPPPPIPSQWQGEAKSRPVSCLVPSPSDATIVARHSSLRHARAAPMYLTPKSSFDTSTYSSSRRSSDVGHMSSRPPSIIVEDPRIETRAVLRVVNPD